MSLRIVRFAVVTAALACAANCAPARAALAAGPPQPMLDVDIVESAQGSSHTSRLTLPLSENGPPAFVETQDSQAAYKLGARIEIGPQDKRVSIELERFDRSPKADAERTSREVKVRTTVPLSPGTRYVLGKVKQSDGRETEVLATVR